MSYPVVLYKYLPPNRLDVLSSGLIRYTQFGAFNDPFDGRPIFSELAPHEYMKEVLEKVLPDEIKNCYEKCPEEFRSLVPWERFSEFVMSKKDELMPGIFQYMEMSVPFVQSHLHQNLDRLVGALSLSEVANEVLMWSHYADGHKGFVVGFDVSHPYFNAKMAETDEFRHLRKVEYREERPSAPMSAYTSIDVFLAKRDVWSYEKEWRILRPLSDAARVEEIEGDVFQVHLLPYPREAIVQIIFGAKMAEQLKLNLLDTLKKVLDVHRVEYWQAVISSKTYGVELERIE